MTEQEWLNCDDHIAMLIHLRGEVESSKTEPDGCHALITHHGELVSGNGPCVSRKRFAVLAFDCCQKWWHLPVNQSSRTLICRFQEFIAGDVSREEFIAELSQAYNST